MKNIIFIIVILNFGNLLSQNKNDYSEIIELIIAEYESDTIKVYKRFQNHSLLSELIRVKSEHDSEIHMKYEKLKDSTQPYKYFDQESAELFDDSVSIKIEKTKIEFFPNLAWVEKKDKGLIKRYYKADFENKRKKRPIAFISVPLISLDNKKAIVYGSYVCGGLCGSGGVFFLEKVRGNWKVIKYEIRWTA